VLNIVRLYLNSVQTVNPSPSFLLHAKLIVLAREHDDVGTVRTEETSCLVGNRKL
jgi:hypothetical protein